MDIARARGLIGQHILPIELKISRWLPDEVAREHTEDISMALEELAQQGAVSVLLEHDKENADLRTALKDIVNALVETMTTLDSVDPNAPSLEAANLAIEKHIIVIGPLIEEIRKEK